MVNSNNINYSSSNSTNYISNINATEGNKTNAINNITSMIKMLIERAVFIESNDLALQRDLGAILGYYLSLLQIDVDVNNVLDI